MRPCSCMRSSPGVTSASPPAGPAGSGRFARGGDAEAHPLNASPAAERVKRSKALRSSLGRWVPSVLIAIRKADASEFAGSHARHRHDLGDLDEALGRLEMGVPL